jgi:hypothetical protein
MPCVASCRSEQLLAGGLRIVSGREEFCRAGGSPVSGVGSIRASLPEARSSGLKKECVARRSAARLPIPRVVSPCVRGSELMWGSDGRWLSRLTAVRSASEESGEKHVQGARDDEG